MIQTPTFIVDEDRCRANIRSMAEKARRNDVIFRPHFKTHQSHEIGSWFKDEGVDRITTSSLTMAAYFAEAGWKDITVAFPANILEMGLINQLAQSIMLNLVVESPETVRGLAKNLQEHINIYIKLDLGYHRTGIAPEKEELISETMEVIEMGQHMTMKGFLGHAGHSYAATNQSEIARVHSESTRLIVETRNKYAEQFPDLLVSVGDTPTCSVMEDFSMVDEIRPGNFVFYDLTQMHIGSCTNPQIAAALACPVVAIHAERNEIIIYGGGVHFSKEILHHPEHGNIFGLGVEDNGESWGDLLDDVVLRKISQEHGTIQAPSSYIDSINVGDIIKVLPVHSCMAADLFSTYRLSSGKVISRLTH
jgi:D-serine deaminase-like pyridoxal phosphate-dependent protein